MPEELDGMNQLLDRIEEAASGERVSIGEVLDVLGRRSFGPILTFGGLLILMPVVGDIPGVPSLVALLVALTVGQILLHRDHVWLPDFLLRRSVKSDTFCKATRWLRRPAGWVDRWTRPRLAAISRGRTAQYVTGGLALAVAVAVPPMEFVPFSANAAGLAFALLGIALLTQDGLLTLVAGSLVLGAVVLTIRALV
ncbi:MAG: exopolysaccharide biosynthesis protein [Gemmatimonadota bacterium]